jgi:hypothetical protein
MTMILRARSVVAAVVVASALVLTVPPAVCDAQNPTPAESARPKRRPRTGDTARAARRNEQTIRRGRTKIRQILRDPNASPEIKQTATELNGLLDRRRKLVGTLKSRHKQFVAQQQADIAALREVAQRGREITARLEAARAEVIRSSNAEITELQQIGERASSLATTLRENYDKEQRARREPR